MSTTTAEEPRAQLLPVPTDPDELARAHRRREQYDRNHAWFQGRVAELGRTMFGRYVCVAGCEVFEADTAAAAAAAGRAAHPEDAGAFVYYFPTHRLPRVHAHPR